jgi:mRNA-degrading endonuclease YafQ of YafQ-DinJ toxin-antitoxin module
VRRTLLLSPAFGRDLRRWLKSHPDTAVAIEATLEQLSADAGHPSLRTHRLRGPLAGCWACSAGSDTAIAKRRQGCGMARPNISVAPEPRAARVLKSSRSPRRGERRH